MRNSHDCNDNVNFVCLTWFWSFPSGRCGQRTWKGNCCVFPFVYRGRRYNSCTRRGSKRFWCPIVPGYKPGQAWGYCRGKQGEIIFVIRFSSNKMSSPLSNLLILVHRGLISSKISGESVSSDIHWELGWKNEARPIFRSDIWWNTLSSVWSSFSKH